VTQTRRSPEKPEQSSAIPKVLVGDARGALRDTLPEERVAGLVAHFNEVEGEVRDLPLGVGLRGGLAECVEGVGPASKVRSFFVLTQPFLAWIVSVSLNIAVEEPDYLEPQSRQRLQAIVDRSPEAHDDAREYHCDLRPQRHFCNDEAKSHHQLLTNMFPYKGEHSSYKEHGKSGHSDP
jgi:hypothetical protein